MKVQNESGAQKLTGQALPDSRAEPNPRVLTGKSDAEATERSPEVASDAATTFDGKSDDLIAERDADRGVTDEAKVGGNDVTAQVSDEAPHPGGSDVTAVAGSDIIAQVSDLGVSDISDEAPHSGGSDVYVDAPQLGCSDVTAEGPLLGTETTADVPHLGGSDVTAEVPDLGGSDVTAEVPDLGGSDVTAEVPDLDGCEVTAEVPDLGGSDVTAEVPDPAVTCESSICHIPANDIPDARRIEANHDDGVAADGVESEGAHAGEAAEVGQVVRNHADVASGLPAGSDEPPSAEEGVASADPPVCRPPLCQEADLKGVAFEPAPANGITTEL
jgi:hypothetical protein